MPVPDPYGAQTYIDRESPENGAHPCAQQVLRRWKMAGGHLENGMRTSRFFQVSKKCTTPRRFFTFGHALDALENEERPIGKWHAHVTIFLSHVPGMWGHGRWKISRVPNAWSPHALNFRCHARYFLGGATGGRRLATIWSVQILGLFVGLTLHFVVQMKNSPSKHGEWPTRYAQTERKRHWRGTLSNARGIVLTNFAPVSYWV